MVDVDGRAMRVRMSVPQRREPGAPFVVLEAGGFGGVDSWETVFSRIAAFASVMAYDRRGLGQSEPDGEPPTPAHVAGVLRKLLQNVGATPPYVLVGHSWGGTLIRVFADRHLDEVTGMVLLDPTDCESSAQDLLGIVRAAGGNEEQFRGLGEMLRAANALLPPGRREMAEQSQRCNVGEAGDLVSSRRVPEVPIAVLIGAAPARTAPEFPLPPSINGVALSAGLHDLRLKHLTALTLASADGLLLVSSGAGHYVQRDDPELTLHAIRHVLTRARRPPR
jgi:pimeloyl-ACP methyl ester carboxylesterase